MGILDPFPVLLLDMNRTFMFGEDRFGDGHDYGATYERLGGRMAPESAARAIQSCFEAILAVYSDPAFHERFPSVLDTLRDLPEIVDLSDDELLLLERTFAVHELGHVPPAYADALHRLAADHRLGLVADIWSPKDLWLNELDRAGVLDLFEATVFSSEIDCVKPSPRGFQDAIVRMGVTREDCVVIGDSARRDVGGARAAGLRAIWIGAGDPPPGVVASAPDLLTLVS